MCSIRIPSVSIINDKFLFGNHFMSKFPDCYDNPMVTLLQCHNCYSLLVTESYITIVYLIYLFDTSHSYPHVSYMPHLSVMVCDFGNRN